MGQLIAPLAHAAVAGGEQPVERALGRQVAALVQQGRPDFCRGAVDEPLAVKDIEHGLALVLRQRPGRHRPRQRDALKARPFLLADLGVLKTHSRPYTSTDNPYSEAQFKTLKYRPEFPERFENIEIARAFCRTFFHWYNHSHRHSGIGLMTPAAVHYGRAEAAHAERQRVLEAAHAATPERFVRRPPRPPALPIAAWINKPTTEEVAH